MLSYCLLTTVYCFKFIIHHSAFIISLEPVAQMDESASLRSLRAHVRVVPGSFDVPGSSKGRMPVFETGDGGSSPSPGVREESSGESFKLSLVSSSLTVAVK